VPLCSERAHAAHHCYRQPAERCSRSISLAHPGCPQAAHLRPRRPPLALPLRRSFPLFFPAARLLPGDQLVSASSDRTVRMWDSRSGECLKVRRTYQNMCSGRPPTFLRTPQQQQRRRQHVCRQAKC
jgi:hypothetical protein